jgi:excisionase family DNA binding protein
MTTIPSPPTPSRGISLKDAASQAPCCVRTLRTAIAQGRLRAFRIGHRIVIKPEDFQTYMQEREVPVIPDELVKQTTCLHSEKAAHHHQALLGEAEQGECDE